MSLSRALNVAQTGLQVYQAALDITSNNISNSSNTSYTRQKVILGSATPTSSGNFLWGNGVTLEDIQRVRDTLTDTQIRTNNSSYSYNDQSSTVLGNIQTLFTEPSSNGLSDVTSSFFTSWQNLAVTPDSVSLRNNVIQAAQALSDKIKTINDGIASVKKDTVTELNGKITTLNTDLKQIQNLNGQITAASTSGQSANDLMDTRDNLIDEISNLTNVNVTYDSTGAAVVTIGGTLAVDRTTSNQFSANEINGKMVIQSSNGTALSSLSGGEIIALTDTYNNKIPEYQSSLDSFANRLMTSVNSLHNTGYSITNSTTSGANFFDSYSDGTLNINQDLVNDPNKIAISTDGTASNGDIATSIADLLNQKDSSGNTIVDNYTTLISNIGSDVQYATNQADSYKTLLTQLNTQKSSYSGVSLDEEMTNVIQYQRSYEACAKVLSTANEMLKTLLTMVS
jgi:flagellar hook-associated protein 1 FlgK